jgi:hypothetical protein
MKRTSSKAVMHCAMIVIMMMVATFDLHRLKCTEGPFFIMIIVMLDELAAATQQAAHLQHVASANIRFKRKLEASVLAAC